MKFFKKKSKLPHLPIEGALPFIKNETRKPKKWSNKLIEDPELFEELEHLNQAIVELREKHDLLIQRKYPIAQIIEKKQLEPTILKKPKNIENLEKKHSLVERKILELDNLELNSSKHIKDITPIPPKPIEQILVPIKVNKIKLKNSKNLIERLQFGVIELQDKWSEVKGRLEGVESPSSKIIDQLSDFEKELNQLKNFRIKPKKIIIKKYQLPKTTTPLNNIKRKNVWIKVQQFLTKINTPSEVIPYELLLTQKHLRDLQNVELEEPKIKLSIPPTKGHTSQLSDKQIIKVRDEMREKFKRINSLSQNIFNDLFSNDLLYINRNLLKMEKQFNKKGKTIISIPPTHGHSSSLSNKKRDKIKKEIKNKIAEIEFSLPTFVDDILYIQNNLQSLNNPKIQKSKIITKTSPSSKPAEIEKTFLQYELNKIEDKLFEKKYFSEPIKKTDQLLDIEKKILDTTNPYSVIQKFKMVSKFTSSDKHSKIEDTFFKKELNQIEDKILGKKETFKQEPIQKTQQLIDIEKKLSEISNFI